MIDRVAGVNSLLAKNVDLASKVEKPKTPFSAFFESAMNNISDASEAVRAADRMSVDFSLGKIDNVADVMIAQEKASIAVSYATTVTNKILDAYNEIMRMQI